MINMNSAWAQNHPGRANQALRRQQDDKVNPQDRQANHMIHAQVVSEARANHNGGHLTSQQLQQIKQEENAVEGGGGTSALLAAMQQNFGG